MNFTGERVEEYVNLSAAKRGETPLAAPGRKTRSSKRNGPSPNGRKTGCIFCTSAVTKKGKESCSVEDFALFIAGTRADLRHYSGHQ